jgi:transcriptional regulator with XRE-family HTH domain
VGEIVKRLRQRRGETLRDVARGTGLSSSFLSLVERGKCDISIRRLALIAHYFDHDLGTLLGYSGRLAKVQYVKRDERLSVDRGPGIDYRVIRVPGSDLEIITVRFQPHAGFADELTHAGFDAALVIEGEVIASVDGVEYPIREGDCATWSGAYPHRLHNDSDKPAAIVAIVSESVY